MIRERPRILRDWVDPEPRSRPALRPLAAIVLIAGLLFLGLQAWWILTPAPGVRSGSRIVEIPAHRGFLEVARQLDDAGVIRSPLGFMLLTIARGSMRSLKAGEYQIPQGANTLAVLALIEGGQVLQHNVVFREGSTLAELARQLENERLAPADDILRVARDGPFLTTLEVPADSVEGYLFPDTYQFVKGMMPEEILARMVARLRDRISPEILAAARARDLSMHQLLTLASIIEKEAVERREMPLISAVFWNRLKLDMPLQADPTVQYAVGKDGSAYARRPAHGLAVQHLSAAGPASRAHRRPSLPAIQAAANPASVNYLYFVATGDDRRHRFSSTLADHNAAVAQYRLGRSR